VLFFRFTTGFRQERRGTITTNGNSTWSHAVGALNPQLPFVSERHTYRLERLSAGLIFIAAGASQPHHFPPSECFRVLSSSHFVSTTPFPLSLVSSHFGFGSTSAYHSSNDNLAVLFSLLLDLPCSYCGERPI
jgi:hypothetical protein